MGLSKEMNRVGSLQRFERVRASDLLFFSDSVLSFADCLFSCDS
jgi:hypothetical protein